MGKKKSKNKRSYCKSKERCGDESQIARFFTTIPSRALPLPVIISIQSNYSSSSKATNSTSKTSHKTFHKLFHVNTSPLVQLKETHKTWVISWATGNSFFVVSAWPKA
ncbi:hypothetical protein Peur_066306 [Populus x canadensis]